MSHTSEVIDTEEAMKTFRSDVAEIDFNEIDVAILVTAEGTHVSMNIVGDLSMAAATLRAALEQVEQSLSASAN
jgi:hypothetical protein